MWISIAQAAQWMGVSRQRVHQLIKKGLFIWRRIGKNIFLEIESVRHVLGCRENAAPFRQRYGFTKEERRRRKHEHIR